MSKMQTSNSESELRSFEKLFRKRRANNQDLAVIISDHQNRRGTGKTVLSLKLGERLDQTEEGLTKEKVAIHPEELTNAYMDRPKGSALVLDEAEAGLSKYEAASSVNRAMREIVNMGRVREKYLIMNLPAASSLDRDLKALCDFWLMVVQKGKAVGHHLKWNQYAEEPRTPRTDGPTGDQTWDWNDIKEGSKLEEIYDYLTEKKLQHLRGESDQSSQRLSAAEVSQKVKQAKRDASKETRDELLKKVYENSELTQRQLADAVDLSRSHLSELVRDK